MPKRASDDVDAGNEDAGKEDAGNENADNADAANENAANENAAKRSRTDVEQPTDDDDLPLYVLTMGSNRIDFDKGLTDSVLFSHLPGTDGDHYWIKDNDARIFICCVCKELGAECEFTTWELALAHQNTEHPVPKKPVSEDPVRRMLNMTGIA